MQARNESSGCVVLPDDPDEIAPDLSEVRWLAMAKAGSMAHFTLDPGKVSRATTHASVEELWYFVSGSGEMCVGDEIISVSAGTSVTIPPCTRFQFRAHDSQKLTAVGVTMPPWPGPDEAEEAAPVW